MIPGSYTKVVLGLFFLLMVGWDTYGQQSAFEIEYLKRLGVKTRTGYINNYVDGKPQRDCVKTIERYNPQGQLEQYTDYRKCGEVYMVFNYQYNAAGKVTSGDMQFMTVSSAPLPFTFTFDEQGRVTHKMVQKPERGFYQNEKLSYDADGNITRVDYLDAEGQIIEGSVSIVHEFSNGRISGFNFTLPQAQGSSRAEFEYDTEGRLITTRYYQSEQLVQTLTYEYSYF
ncbi:MAG: hypothetical protein ACFB10_00150 [Salibacteraceae bacterium]